VVSHIVFDVSSRSCARCVTWPDGGAAGTPGPEGDGMPSSVMFTYVADTD
jgi:hypothetical protein